MWSNLVPKPLPPNNITRAKTVNYWNKTMRKSFGDTISLPKNQIFKKRTTENLDTNKSLNLCQHQSNSPVRFVFSPRRKTPKRPLWVVLASMTAPDYSLPEWIAMQYVVQYTFSALKVPYQLQYDPYICYYFYSYCCCYYHYYFYLLVYVQ